jgi:hypothetical protein
MLRCIEGHSLYNSGLFWGTITGFQSAFRKTFSRTRRVVEHDTRGLCVNIWHFKVCSTMSRQQKWLLTIYVSDLNVEKTLEVTGQTFVGNLMVELVNRLGRPMLLYMLAGLQVFITCVLYVNWNPSYGIENTLKLSKCVSSACDDFQFEPQRLFDKFPIPNIFVCAKIISNLGAVYQNNLINKV